MSKDQIHSLEDLEVFSKIITMFDLLKDEEEANDISKPKPNKTNMTEYLSTIDGFVSLEYFKELLSEQGHPQYDEELEKLNLE